MIPVRLELTNFLSYRDTAVLEFNDIHLACIAGPNGAGKSSIMDAMTWALFGKSRSSSDDDLVNRQAGGDAAAEVRFTFCLEDLNYRVIRSKRPGKTTILELQMDSGGGNWQPLSESKVWDTQAAIQDLLRMNYDTFTNASFLLQGKADQFTTRTASQRKEILAELLGVTQWEKYREQAAAARKETEGSMALLDGRLAEILSELEQEQARREALEAAKAEQQLVSDRLEVKEQLLGQARLNEAARVQQRQAVSNLEGQVRRLQAKLAEAQQTLDGRLQRRAELAATVEQAAAISATYAAYQEAEAALQAQQELSNRHNQLQQAMQPFWLQLTDARSRLEQRRHGLEERAAHVETARVERTSLIAASKEAEEALAAAMLQSEQLAAVEADLQDARQQLQQIIGQRQLMQKELQSLQIKARAIEDMTAETGMFEQSKAAAEAFLASANEQLVVINAQRDVFAQRQAEQQAIKAQQPALYSEMQERKERISELSAADTDGECPLCAQPLSEEHRQNVLQTLQAEGKTIADTYRANEARQKALDLEIKQLEKTLQQSQPLERDVQAQQKRLAQAEARLEENARQRDEWAAQDEKRLVELAAALADESAWKVAQERVNELETAVQGRSSLNREVQELQNAVAADKARLAEIERALSDWESTGKKQLQETIAQLEGDSYAPEARRELARLQEELDGVGYDPRQHEAASSRREDLAAAPQRYQTLQQARAALEPLERSLEDLQKQISEDASDLDRQSKQLAVAKEQLSALEADHIDLRALEAEVQVLREKRIAADHEVGAAQQLLNVLDDQRRQREKLLAAKAELAERVARLKQLETACGRKGVQALLIEHALPEIEDGANDLLERLTGGEMRVRFDTQKQLKSKKDTLAETLDIVISDRAGDRPYDNYSGGEQFRINFAIRLALSKMLANRAGARLQTLVIDEGFGSQDPEGRQRLIEAINAVQDQFACILVITHIDELREAFPTRIEVQKDPNGSQISVL